MKFRKAPNTCELIVENPGKNDLHQQTNRLSTAHRTLQTSRIGPPASNCSSCSRMAEICSCWFDSNRCVATVLKTKSAAATWLYGLDLGSNAIAINMSAMRGIAHQQALRSHLPTCPAPFRSRCHEQFWSCDCIARPVNRPSALKCIQ